MALIIEDGSLVHAANSFVSVEEVRAYASARALTLPSDDTVIEAGAIKSADYLKGIRHLFKGHEIAPEQALPFPRYNLVVNNFTLSSSTIPAGIKDASCQLAIEAANGLDLQPTTTGQITIREKVGPLETEFAPNSAPDGSNLFAKAASILRPFTTNAGGGGGLTSVRI